MSAFLGGHYVRTQLIDNVTRRVRLWNEVAPYYSDRESGADKATESRGTEAVLSALVLAYHDAQNGRLSEDTRTALDNMWALQQTKGDDAGAWPWLQFGLSPWEGRDSQYGRFMSDAATAYAVLALTRADRF